MNSSSLALADTMAFAEDHVLLTLGVRHQSIKQQNYDYLGPATTRNNDSRTSPLAAVVFKANKNLSFYANYAEGLVKGDNAPQFNFVPFYPIANANQALSTYVSKQKELGVKYDAGMFGASAAFFSTIQPTAFVNPMTQTYGRYGEQRNEGVELSVFGEPTKGLRLLGGVTFLDAKQISSPSGATDGRDAIGVPGQQWNIGGDWDVPGMRGFAMNARLLNTSKQYADSANAQAVPSWTRMDIGARYLTEVAGKLLTLRGRIDNVANKSYWASAGGYPGQGYLVLGAPRTFSLTASVEF
jgi:iron complex outermembrane receptor protein